MKKTNLEFKLGTGQAKSYVESLRDGLVKDGWKSDASSLSDQAGVVVLSKGKERLTLTINYTDTGFLPTEISISSIGAELEQSSAAQ